MSTSKTIPKEILHTAEDFVKSLWDEREKGGDHDAMLTSRRINKAYDKMIKAVATYVEDRFHYGYSISEAAYNLSYWISSPDKGEAQDAARGFATYIENLLSHLEGVEWLSVTALPWHFQAFPRVSVFDGFSIINMSKSKKGGMEQRLKSFSRFLEKDLQVNTIPSPPNRDTYGRLGDHYYKKSDGEIPTRPMILLKCGSGEEPSARRNHQSLMRAYIPLLQLAELLLPDTLLPLHTFPVRPDGSQIHDGITNLVPASLSFEKTSGRVEWWPAGLQLTESSKGMCLNPRLFRVHWRKYSQPLLDLEHRDGTAKVCAAIRNSISVLARGRNLSKEDQLLNYVIAIESLQKPFEQFGSIKDRFCLHTAHLIGQSFASRNSWYQKAARLYNHRNSYVHTGKLDLDGSDAYDMYDDARHIFISTLIAIYKWAGSELDRGNRLTAETHRQYYDKLILT